MTINTQVAVVGAGPYGLSVAAHLRSSGVDFRIFGSPMHTWCEQMPDGMMLKSDGFASNLSDPEQWFTLQRFCWMTDTAYDDTRVPIRIDTFRAYGLAFQQRMVPELENVQVIRIEKDGNIYRLHLDNQTAVSARAIVLAVGISHFQYVPPVLSALPAHCLSHSANHRDLSGFAGRSVAVVGGGASAIDTAVLLRDTGAEVTLIARQPRLKFSDPPSSAARTWWNSLRHPSSPIGPGWRSRILSDAPWVFRFFPHAIRSRTVRAHTAPKGGWAMKDRFVGRVTALLGHTIEKAELGGGQVQLTLVGTGGRAIHTADHVIAATGYRVDLRRLTFLSKDIRNSVRAVNHAPVLSSRFESSVPQLYFVGAAAADTFGPTMRFACGAAWTAKRLAATLAESPLANRAAPAVVRQSVK